MFHERPYDQSKYAYYHNELHLVDSHLLTRIKKLTVSNHDDFFTWAFMLDEPPCQMWKRITNCMGSLEILELATGSALAIVCFIDAISMPQAIYASTHTKILIDFVVCVYPDTHEREPAMEAANTFTRTSKPS